MPPPMPPTPSRVEGHHREALWWTLVLVILIALGVLWFWGASVERVDSSFPRIVFYGAGAPAWYALDEANARLIAVHGPSVSAKSGAEVLDATTPVSMGDVVTPILAQVKGQPGTVLGIVRPDGTFEPLLADGTEKEGIAARPDGIVAYSVPAPGGLYELLTFDLVHATRAPVDTGPGRDPAFSQGLGAFLAFVPNGLQFYHPTLATSTLAVFNPGPGPGDAVSPRGAVVAIADSASSVSFYTLGVAVPPPANFVGTLSAAHSGGGAFLDDTHYLAREGKTATLYLVPDGKQSREATAVKTYTISP